MTILNIAVTKVKGLELPVDTDKLPQEIYEQALAEEQAKQAKAEVANRILLETRGRLFSRLKTIQAAAIKWFCCGCN